MVPPIFLSSSLPGGILANINVSPCKILHLITFFFVLMNEIYRLNSLLMYILPPGVEHIHPKWRFMDQQLATHTLPAMHEDAYVETHPIQVVVRDPKVRFTSLSSSSSSLSPSFDDAISSALRDIISVKRIMGLW